MKPAARLVALDALRGVAAILVVFYHMGAVGWVPQPRFGYLAVDLFFVLSGFVLAQAYDGRFAAGMTVRQFMLRRVIRLFPLYLAGLALGVLCMALVGPEQLTHGLRPVVILLCNALLLPTPFIDFRPAGLFPYDPPAWSLFLELYVGSLGYALIARRLTPLLLGALLGVSAVLLVLAQAKLGGLDFGVRWGESWSGVIRILFSFFAGVGLSRAFRRARPAWGLRPGLAMALLFVVLVAPLSGTLGRIHELACIFVVFPALVYFTACSQRQVSGANGLLGDISYPLYLIHYPLILLAAGLAAANGVQLGAAAAALFVAALLAASYALDRCFDDPVAVLLASRLRPVRSRSEPARSEA